MRTIAHLSDLHFGAEDPLVTQSLLDDLIELSPSLVVVSGDLTQRARRFQFLQAREFLNKIPFPILVVPGNHDVPLFDVFRRFLRPLQRYKRQITEVLNPMFQDEEIFVLGVNTARSFAWKEGRISVEQIRSMQARFCSAPTSLCKILVTHHPFIPPPHEPGVKLVGRASLALESIAKCQVQLLLAGHLHHGYAGDVRSTYPLAGFSALSVQAGTACSRRTRHEPNAYNRIEIVPGHICVTVRVWNAGRFIDSTLIRYQRDGLAWAPESREVKGPAAEKTRTDFSASRA